MLLIYQEWERITWECPLINQKRRIKMSWFQEVARVNEDCVDIQRHLNDKYFSQ